MLNFTMGAASLKSALCTAQVKRVITAHRLVEMAGLQDLIAGLDGIEIVYLEDVRKKLVPAQQAGGAGGQTDAAHSWRPGPIRRSRR